MARSFKKPPKSDPKSHIPVTRENLAANRMMVGNEDLAAGTTESQVEIQWHEKSSQKSKSKRQKKKWGFRKAKAPAEAPAIQINKPAPTPTNRILKQEVKPFFNSFGWFIVAYLASYLLYQGATILAASAYHIDSVLYYYEVYFPVGNNSPLWNRLNIIVITFIGPFISLVAAIILLRGILPLKKPGLKSRIFFIWMAWFGIAHFFGAFVGGIITNLGFGYVANWLYLSVWLKILVSLIFLFVMAVIGYHTAGYLHETIPPTHRLKPSRLRPAIISRFIAPLIPGVLLLIAVKLPNKVPQHENIQVYDAVILCSMFFMAVPAFFNFRASGRTFINKEQWIKKLPGIGIFILALLLLAGFRLLLSQGIYFLIRFTFEMGLYK
ncbi:hypothetical protein DSECCO2_633970 [anaerobic digester metagenome]